MKSGIVYAILGLSATSYASPLQARDSVSSCGSSWMAINDVRTNHQQIQRIGYDAAVDDFCAKASGQLVVSKKYLSMAGRVWLDFGGNPETTGNTGFVYFEIHNNGNGDHTVELEQCKENLKKMSSADSKCYGKDHNDTQGGSYQLSSGSISYHALANKVPPATSSFAQTIITDSALSPLANGGKGNTLTPFPTYVFASTIPIDCHSHNDYTRDVALFSALSAGCISVEADIYAHDEKLVVGHTDPGSNGQTIQDLYLDPIKALIDANGAIFPAKPDQGLYLLVDFKGDADQTWDLLVKALEPLRNTGFLSRWDGEFKQGLLTVVASGNAIKDGDVPEPIAKANDLGANPGRALFVDARIGKDLSKFDRSNAVYASASFKDAVQSASGVISSVNLQKMRAQVTAAKEKGFKVRYWDIPSKDQWQQLIDEGVDRLNVDELQNVASLDWKL